MPIPIREHASSRCTQRDVFCVERMDGRVDPGDRAGLRKGTLINEEFSLNLVRTMQQPRAREDRQLTGAFGPGMALTIKPLALPCFGCVYHKVQFL
jgi:hypothetical protein